jgi:trans-aconitate methyltransferase
VSDDIRNIMNNHYDQSVSVFNDFADEYEKRFMDISLYKEVMDSLLNRIKCTGNELLELGCGPGNITRYLKARMPELKITGIDLSENMIEKARKNVPDAEFRVMDVRRIKELHHTYDVIIASFCLPFLSYPDFEKMIRDCKDILNNNGILYISTMEGTADRAGFEATSFSGNHKVYFNYYKKEHKEDELKKNDFEIVEYRNQRYDNSLHDLIFIAKKK